jgi:hypothetical protein
MVTSARWWKDGGVGGWKAAVITGLDASMEKLEAWQ